MTSAGEPDDGNVVNVCVELPIVPVLVFASVDLHRSAVGAGVRVAPQPERHGDVAAGQRHRQRQRRRQRPATGAPNATVTAASVPGGLRDNATAGVLRRYSGFAPDDGNADGDTISCGAAGAAPGPPGFAIVAVLSIGVIGGVPAAMRAANTIVTLPFAGTAMSVTLTRPVPFAPVPAPVEALRAPGRHADDGERAELGGEIVDDADAVAATPADSTSVIV